MFAPVQRAESILPGTGNGEWWQEPIRRAIHCGFFRIQIWLFLRDGGKSPCLVDGRMREGVSLLPRFRGGHVVIPGCSWLLEGVLGQRLGLPVHLDGPDAGVFLSSRVNLWSYFWRTLHSLGTSWKRLMMAPFISQLLHLAAHRLDPVTDGQV